ncbi:MAG: ankyrin repeat domain-containing protein [Bacteroidales bacterium]|nr:ankyrin repeat domain-containing protein [Bacteroidales bacterium]MBN2699106.1 ankyrin repeat domain-containing protein [Bacteroidales bacterium]
MKNLDNLKNLTKIAIMFAGLIASANLFSQDELLSKVKYNDIDAVKALIAAGSDINQQDESYGYTALMWACEFDYVDMAKLLIAEGADINITAKDGSTALVRAAGNAPGAVGLLLEKGADVKVVPDDGIGVMNQAVFGVLFKGYSMESFETLLSHGGDVDEAIGNLDPITGFTPLLLAVRENNEEVAKYLIGKGANVNARAANGKTPLSLASEEGFNGMVELLKANGAE